ncbi:MAG: hypothetical protein AAFY29_23325 [Pseudomonadota bacterium]
MYSSLYDSLDEQDNHSACNSDEKKHLAEGLVALVFTVQPRLQFGQAAIVQVSTPTAFLKVHTIVEATAPALLPAGMHRLPGRAGTYTSKQE